MSAVALTVAMAMPAMAQSSSATGAASAPSTAASQSSAASADQVKWKAMTQDKLRQQLTDAGFKDIRIVDAAYLIEARTKDGDPVTLMINPPSMKTTSNATGSSAANTTGSVDSSASSSSG